MILELVIDGLPHCPRNRSHTIKKKGKFSFIGKTKIAEAYEDAIRQELKQFQFECLLFKQHFNPLTQAISAKWMLYSPDTLTKAGKVSENSTDLDAHKVLQDTIFEFVGIDDAYVVNDFRAKRQGDFKVLLTLAIVEIPK